MRIQRWHMMWIVVAGAEVSITGLASSGTDCEQARFTQWDPADPEWAEAVRSNDRKLRLYLASTPLERSRQVSDPFTVPDSAGKRQSEVAADAQERSGKFLNVHAVTFFGDSLQYSYRKLTHQVWHDVVDRIDYRSGHKSLAKGARHGATIAVATTFWTSYLMLFTVPIGTGAGTAIAAITPRWVPLYCAQPAGSPAHPQIAASTSQVTATQPRPPPASRATVREQRPNVVGLEYRGRGVHPAFNYERHFTNNVGMGLGATAHHNSVIVPFYFSAMWGDEHSLYFASGGTFSLGIDYLPEMGSTWALTGALGYQFQTYGGFIFRALATVFVLPDDEEQAIRLLAPGVTCGGTF
jgi:hypothetical protein